jgi:hypothetical protein
MHHLRPSNQSTHPTPLHILFQYAILKLALFLHMNFGFVSQGVCPLAVRAGPYLVRTVSMCVYSSATASVVSVSLAILTVPTVSNVSMSELGCIWDAGCIWSVPEACPGIPLVVLLID